jgi:hypothetical protein
MAVVGMAVVAAACVVAGSAAGAWDSSIPYIDGNGDGRDAAAVVRVDAASGAMTWFFSDRGGSLTFGNVHAGDIRVAGDYDGDGVTDPAVYRPGTPASTWYVALSSGGYRTLAFGDAAHGDVPVQADFDGDRRTDFAVYRPGSPASTWIVALSGGGYRTFSFGDSARNDVPMPGDFDCDGRADDVVLRPRADGNVTTIVHGSRLGAFGTATFGRVGDTFLPGDWDGDGCADLVVVRTSQTDYLWYGWTSSKGYTFTQAGAASGVSVPFGMDCNGDGVLDPSYWRSPPFAGWQGTWGCTYGSQLGTGASLGINGDLSVNADFNRTVPSAP